MPARRGLSLTLKIFLGTAAVVAVVLGVALAITARSAERAADETVDRALASGRQFIVARFEERGRSLMERTQTVAGYAPFRSALESAFSALAGADAFDQADVAATQIGADWVQLVDADGIRRGKSDDPEASEVSLARSPMIQQALRGEPTSAFGVSGDTMLVQLAAVPIAGASRIIGALMAARVVDDAFAVSMKEGAATGVEVIFFSLDTLDLPVISGSTLGRDAPVTALLAAFPAATADEGPDVQMMRSEVDLAGTHYVGLGAALRSASGNPIGGFAILRDRDAEFAVFAQLQRTILLIGAIGVVLAGLLALLLARQITRPVAALVTATQRATDGDYGAEIPASSRDEIGALATAFRRLLTDLREKQALVDFLGGSDTARTVQLNTMSLTKEQRIAEGGLVPGARFAGRYEVKEILGEGGMGTVFKAVDTELGEVIAIKTLKGDFLQQDPTALERFKSEIRLARRISHRNVVRTHDLGENAGVYYITMEYIEGRSLKELIRARGRLPVAVVLSVGKQLARALEIAHEQGVIHRDIKPANMVVEPDGVLKVMDFGIARLATRPEQSGVTQAGTIIGTPEYMAPEQVMGKDIDARADLYAAGCVLYECLIGRPPITAETPYQLVARLIEDVPVAPRSLNPEVPPALDALIVAMLAKEPEGRPATALAVYDRLASIG